MKTVHVGRHQRVTRRVKKQEEETIKELEFRPLPPTLPQPWEVPKVTKDQLRRLYRRFALGLEDEDLLNEVESRLVARGDVWTRLATMWWTAGGDEIESAQESREAEEVQHWFRQYGMYMSFDSDELEEAYQVLLHSRGGSFRDRMLAVNGFIMAVHEGGVLADNFVEGLETWDRIKETSAERFLNELNNLTAGVM